MFTNLFAGIAVADFERGLAFYEDLFKRPPDLVPTQGDVAWRLTDTAWLNLREDAESAGHAIHTLLVDDLESFAPEQERKGGMRIAWVTDPEGNRLQFAQQA
jgi:predicted enzyme related to lactoylglutathione lyase